MFYRTIEKPNYFPNKANDIPHWTRQIQKTCDKENEVPIIQIKKFHSMPKATEYHQLFFSPFPPPPPKKMTNHPRPLASLSQKIKQKNDYRVILSLQAWAIWGAHVVEEYRAGALNTHSGSKRRAWPKMLFLLFPKKKVILNAVFKLFFFKKEI